MVSEVHYSSDRPDWPTPQWLINELRDEGYEIVLDVCATEDNAKAAFWITPNTDTLSTNWRRVMKIADVKCSRWAYMNPPYGRPEKACSHPCKKKTCKKRGYHLDQRRPGIEDFVQKAHYEQMHNGIKTIALIPNRPGQWWKGPLLKPAQNSGSGHLVFDEDDDATVWVPRYSMDFFINRIRFAGADTGAPFNSVLVYMAPVVTPRIRFRIATNVKPQPKDES